ncbi:MAG TPA: FAD-binding oxidoreductase [Myxococcota bacterium]
MSDDGALERLRAELGAGALERHAPVNVDGVLVRATLRPDSGEALARALAASARHGLAVLPRGGGTHGDLGNPPRRADLLLSTQRLRGVDEFEPAEGVCHAAAGTTLAALRAAIRGEGWELPLDVPDDAATLGGALAVAAVGPRAHGYGPARDAVLGLEVALANGARTRCGGRVVKNVTGYDLAKLYTGSLGTLGVIEAAWLRLRPAPEAVRVVEVPPAPLESACGHGITAARRSSVRACALRSDADATLLGVLELAGDAASVERDARWLAEALGAEERAPAALDAVGRAQRGVPEPCGLRFRLALLPSALGASAAHLAAAGASLLLYPGLNLVYAGFALEGPDDTAGAERAFRTATDVARASSGALLCESAPPAAKRERDVFAPEADALRLLRSLKAQFDPDGVLNPGRFAGRL